MSPPDWLWIPITIAAALAQTGRNAAQRHLTPVLGTLGATLIRFLYGLPFAVLWLIGVQGLGGYERPALGPAFFGWVLLSSVAQIGATALLLTVMTRRNFALGVAYAKTEVMQVAVYGLIFLGDPLTAATVAAVALATCGVMLLAPIDPAQPVRTLLRGWTTRSALLGIASGGLFGIASVSYRGASLTLDGTPFLMAAACTLLAAQSTQTLLLGGWLLVREGETLARVRREWRRSLVAGFLGAAASAGWLTALALEPAAHVRTLALVELVFSYLLAHRLFRERVTRLEIAGLMLLMVGLSIVALG